MDPPREMARVQPAWAPCNADAAIASVLGVPEGTAILFMESLTVNKQQHPVMLNREYYHPDMLKFREVRNTLFR